MKKASLKRIVLLARYLLIVFFKDDKFEFERQRAQLKNTWEIKSKYVKTLPSDRVVENVIQVRPVKLFHGVSEGLKSSHEKPTGQNFTNSFSRFMNSFPRFYE